jgi:hypothetical protein
MAITGCGINSKSTKHKDKCNNKTEATKKQNDETRDKHFFQNTVKIT